MAGSEPVIPASERTQTVRPTGSVEGPYAHQKCTLVNLGHIEGIARIALVTQSSIFYVDIITGYLHSKMNSY